MHRFLPSSSALMLVFLLFTNKCMIALAYRAIFSYAYIFLSIHQLMFLIITHPDCWHAFKLLFDEQQLDAFQGVELAPSYFA